MKPKHPAMFTPAIVDLMVERLANVRGTLIDPFAGMGMHLHRFCGPGRRVIGYEIEQPWVDAGGSATAGLIRQGDSTKLPHRKGSIAAIFTSPVYPNRMTDHHRARDNSERRSYTHDIRTMTGNAGYELAVNNAGKMSGGLASADYRTLNVRVLRECLRVARPGAVLLLNVSDSYMDDEIQSVTAWFIAAAQKIGWEWRTADRVPTPRMRRGKNGTKRVDGEWVLEFVKSEAPS